MNAHKGKNRFYATAKFKRIAKKAAILLTAMVVAYFIVYTAVKHAIGDAVTVAINDYYETHDFNPTIIP